MPSQDNTPDEVEKLILITHDKDIPELRTAIGLHAPRTVKGIKLTCSK